MAASEPLNIYLCRHGETDWSLSGQHTGRTDLSLNAQGIKQLIPLKKRLQKVSWNQIYSSPLKRALETCQLMQLHLPLILEPRAVEWNYGNYEGKTTLEIDQSNPSWNLFLQGAPGGETPDQVAGRADGLLADLRKQNGNILLFSHGHFLRVLAARWLNLPPAEGRLFALSVASLSILSTERKQPVIEQWNDVAHLGIS